MQYPGIEVGTMTNMTRYGIETEYFIREDEENGIPYLSSTGWKVQP
jgi:hypothetical protein